MQKFFMLLLCCCIAMIHCEAQNPQFSRDGRNKVSTFAPFQQPGGHTQLMYPASCFAVKPPSGLVTSLFFRNYNIPRYHIAGFFNLSITLLQTTDTVFTNNSFYTGGMAVMPSSYFYTVTLSSISADGWLEIPVNGSFIYDQTKTLIVDIRYDYPENPVFTWGDSTVAYNCKVCTSSSLTATTGSLSQQWTYFGMNITPGSPCTGPPTAGTATSKRTGVCGTAQYFLGLTGCSAGFGQTYQWQQSAAATGPYTNVGAATATPGYSVSPSVNTWYRAAVTCGAFTSYSFPTIVGANNYLPAGTYTIDNRQPTGGLNYRTINAANSAMSCGISGPVIFNIAPDCDTFFDHSVLQAVPNSSAVNTVRLNGNGNKLAYMVTDGYSSFNNNQYSVLELDGISHLLLDSLIVARTDTLSYASYLNGYLYATYFGGVQIDSNANCIAIQHCTFVGKVLDTVPAHGFINCWGNAGILTGSYLVPRVAGDSISIQHNTFINASVSLFGNGSSTNPVTGSSVSNNIFISDSMLSYNPYVYNVTKGCIHLSGMSNTIIEQNEMKSCRGYNYGIYVDNSSPGAVISKNKISSPWSTLYNYYTQGTIYAEAIHTTIKNNLISSLGGIILQNGAGDIFHNTVPNIQIVSANSSYPTLVKNNIISNNFVTSYQPYTVTGLGISNSTNVISDYNDFYCPLSNPVTVYQPLSSNTVVYPTLAAWQTASGQDLNSQILDPQFTSPSTGNYRPGNPLLDDKGTPIAGITDDIVGGNRNTLHPDIGAYEFGFIYCDSPTNLAVSGVTTTTANISWTPPAGSNVFAYVLDQNSTDPAVTGTAVTGNSYNATGLQPYTTYYFHLRTNCSGLYSRWVTRSFTTLCVAPSALITPSGIINQCQTGVTTLTTNAGTNVTYQWLRNGIPIAGATGATYSTSLGGAYTVAVSMNTCTTTSSSVTINRLPGATITAAGSTTICPSGNVALSANTGAGFTWQWQQNGINVPGANNVSYNATSAGSYRAIVSNGTCIDTSNAIAVTVVPAPSDVITSTGPAAFCSGRSARLNAVLNPVYTYQWYRNGIAVSNANSSFYDATLPGSYTVVISNGSCSVTSNAIQVTVYPLPVATAFTTGATVFCNTGVVNMQAASGAGYTYQWLRNGISIPGATASYYTAIQEGLFSVAISNGQCSDTSAGMPVVFNTYPRPVIVLNNGVLSTTNTFPTYQWNRNGVMIPFANSQTYIPTVTGNYVCVVSDTSGCLGSSNVIVINSLGVGNNTAASIRVYPNPATDLLYIQSNEKVLMINMITADGRTILSQLCTGTIDIAGLPKGIYTLKIAKPDGGLLKVEKVVKH